MCHPRMCNRAQNETTCFLYAFKLIGYAESVIFRFNYTSYDHPEAEKIVCITHIFHIISMT